MGVRLPILQRLSITAGLRRLKIAILMKTRVRLLEAGSGFYCSWTVAVRPNCVIVGDDVFFGPNCQIRSKTRIGHFVMLAGNVSIVGGDHVFTKPGTPIRFSGRDENVEVVIEDDAWIGHRATIMHGVRIGRGAIVGAGSVVVKDVPAFEIWAGNPARRVRPRFGDEADRVAHSKMLDQYRFNGTWNTTEGSSRISETGVSLDRQLD